MVFGRDLLAPALPEHLEGVAVVGVAVDPHHVGLGVDPVHGLADVVDPFEEAGHLVDAVDEHEGPHLGELAEQMAYTRCRVNRAKAATEPEMSATTKISGLDGRG